MASSATELSTRRGRRAKPRAAIYVRLDGGRGGRASADEQERACRDVAEAHGWAVAAVFKDNDVSAYAHRQRTGYEAMLDEIRAGRITAIAAYHVEKLVRRNPELEPLIQLCDELGVQMATATGEIDLATDSGRAFAKQLGAFSRYEAQHRAERTSQRNAERAENGQPWVSGTRCYGYDADGVTILDEEADVIRDVARRIIRGESLRSICLHLDQEGHTTTRGNSWHPAALKRLMTNVRLVGLRAYQGKTTTGDWPAILEPTVRQQVVDALDDRAATYGRGRPAAPPRRYLLTGGLLICGLCGNALSSQPSGARKRGYVCRKGAGQGGCGRIRIAADPIEAEVAERVLSRLASPSIRRRLAAALNAGDGFSGDRILEKITGEEARLAELGNDYADRKIGRLEFHAARDRIQARLDDLRAQSAGAACIRSLPGTDPESLAAWWVDADLPRRRDLVALLLDHIVVGKATRYGPGGLDTDRLSWVWRID